MASLLTKVYGGPEITHEDLVVNQKAPCCCVWKNMFIIFQFTPIYHIDELYIIKYLLMSILSLDL